MANVAIVASQQEVVRPLRVLEGLLKEKFQQAEQAAEDARKPYYEEIAPLLVEAKECHFVGNTTGFFAWATKKFGISQTTTRRYIAFLSASSAKSFKNLQDYRETPKRQGGSGETSYVRREWTAPVDAVAERARREAFRLAQDEALTRTQEREAEKKLGHRLIDIGYKVLAKELHPDKMHGDKTAFQRLNRVRDQLKNSI
jgi:hypothetical protein